MITITTQIEFIDQDGDFGCFDVELTGNPVMVDYSYNDEYGTVKQPTVFELDGDVTWRYKDYTDSQNKQIAEYIEADRKGIEELFFNEF